MGWEPENSFLLDPFTDVPGERKVSGPRTVFTDAKGGMSGDCWGISPSKIGIDNDMMGTLKIVGNH